jgi:hypothetical protein
LIHSILLSKTGGEQNTDLSHINPNGSVASIQKWARIAFQDSTTGAIDETQQRALEVITSIFVSTFYDEADRNVNITTDTGVEPYNPYNYIHLQSQFKRLAGIWNERQLIMFLSIGAGGSGKTEVISILCLLSVYAEGFSKEIGYFFDK